jgi:hypothetical protein
MAGQAKKTAAKPESRRRSINQRVQDPALRAFAPIIRRKRLAGKASQARKAALMNPLLD